MSQRQTCSHDECPSELPEDESKIPPGWTVARVEEYKKNSISIYYLYICPNHTLTTAVRQTDLFGGT